MRQSIVSETLAIKTDGEGTANPLDRPGAEPEENERRTLPS